MSLKLDTGDPSDISRRDFLKIAGLIATSLGASKFLAACDALPVVATSASPDGGSLDTNTPSPAGTAVPTETAVATSTNEPTKPPEPTKQPEFLSEEQISTMTLDQKKTAAPELAGATKSGVANESMVVYRDSNDKPLKVFDLKTGEWLSLDDPGVMVEKIGVGQVLVETTMESENITLALLEGNGEVKHGMMVEYAMPYMLANVGEVSQFQFAGVKLSRKELQRVTFTNPYREEGVVLP